MTNGFASDVAGARHFGLYPAIVTDIVDKDALGRIEVKFPWLGQAGQDVRAWATLLTPYADDGQGFEFLPSVDTQVVVGFEAGDLRRPYIVGSCWNGKEGLPQTAQQANNLRVIKTRAGTILEFDDSDGAAKVTLKTASGHQLVLDDGTSEVRVAHNNGSSLVLEASGNVTMTAIGQVTVVAPSGLTVNAPSATFSGSVTCMAFTATSVTSPIYSPGAGNVW